VGDPDSGWIFESARLAGNTKAIEAGKSVRPKTEEYSPRGNVTVFRGNPV
jgi:hypothetical protein